MSLELTPQRDGGIALAIKVVPGASRDRIAGEYAGGVKVTVSKAPEAGAANKAVVAMLAEALGVPAAQVRITRGHQSPRKQVLITGVGDETIRQRLMSRIETKR
jgi:uncharacterized protein (TIGR00251 family)